MGVKIKIQAENLERVKSQLDSLLDTVGKSNLVGRETHKQMNKIGTEWRGILREQNLVINSWRIMHPQLSLLTRGLSNVATVGHILVNAFQAMSIMQLRQKHTADDLTTAQQDYNNKHLITLKMLEKYNDITHPKYLEALGEEQEALNKVVGLKDNLKAENWQDLGQKIAIALSLAGVGSNIANTIVAFKALGVSMVGTGGAGGLVAISKLVSAAFVSMWAKVLAPVSVFLGLDYIISKMLKIPSLLEIGAAQFPALDFKDMLPTPEATKAAQDLFNQRTLGIQGGIYENIQKPIEEKFGFSPGILTGLTSKDLGTQFKEDLDRGLKPLYDLGAWLSKIFSIPSAAGEMSNISNVAGVPFGPPQPTARENYIASGGDFGKKMLDVLTRLEQYIAGGGHFGRRPQTTTFTDPLDKETNLLVGDMKDMGDIVSRFTEDDLLRFSDTFKVSDLNIEILGDKANRLANEGIQPYLPTIQDLDLKSRILIGSYGKNVSLVEGNSESLVVSNDKLKKWSETHKVGVDTLNPLIQKYADGTLTAGDLDNAMGKTTMTLEAFRRFMQSITISRKGKFSAGFANVGGAELAGPGGTLTTQYGPGFGGEELVPIPQGGVPPIISGAVVNLSPVNPNDLNAGFLMDLLGKKKSLTITDYNAINRQYTNPQPAYKELFRGMFPEYNFAGLKGAVEFTKPTVIQAHEGETLFGKSSGGGTNFYFGDIIVQGSIMKENEVIDTISQGIARKVQAMIR